MSRNIRGLFYWKKLISSNLYEIWHKFLLQQNKQLFKIDLLKNHETRFLCFKHKQIPMLKVLSCICYVHVSPCVCALCYCSLKTIHSSSSDCNCLKQLYIKIHKKCRCWYARYIFTVHSNIKRNLKNQVYMSYFEDDRLK